MIELTKQTPGMTARHLASRVRKRRRERHITQAEMAKRIGISLSSYKRFEQKGQISLTSLLWIAQELDCLEEFAGLFAMPYYASIEEVRHAYKKAQQK